MNLIFIIGITLGTSLSFSSDSFEKADRIKYAQDALNATLRSPRNHLTNTYRYLNTVRGNRCISERKLYEVQCLLESAKKNCNDPRGSKIESCHLYSDVILATLLEKPRIVTRKVLAKLSKKTELEMSEASEQVMTQHFAIQALRLIEHQKGKCLHGDWNCLAKEIESYCDEYAKTNSGSWHGCAGGLIYFIGSAQRSD